MFPQLALTGLSALSGLFGGRSQTTTFDQTQNAKGSSSESGATRRFLTPEQQAAMAMLMQFAGDRLSNPGQGLDSILATQRNKVAQSFTGVPQKIADMTLAHGGSNSGKFRKGVRQAAMGQASAMTDINNQQGAMALDQQNSAAQLLMSILGQQMGADQTGSSSFDNTTTTKGTQKGPSNMMGGLMGGAGGMAGYLYGAGKW